MGLRVFLGRGSRRSIASPSPCFGSSGRTTWYSRSATAEQSPSPWGCGRRARPRSPSPWRLFPKWTPTPALLWCVESGALGIAARGGCVCLVWRVCAVQRDRLECHWILFMSRGPRDQLFEGMVAGYSLFGMPKRIVCAEAPVPC